MSETGQPLTVEDLERITARFAADVLDAVRPLMVLPRELVAWYERWLTDERNRLHREQFERRYQRQMMRHRRRVRQGR